MTIPEFVTHEWSLGTQYKDTKFMKHTCEDCGICAVNTAIGWVMPVNGPCPGKDEDADDKSPATA